MCGHFWSPPILKYHKKASRNRFCFCSRTNKKNCGFLKKNIISRFSLLYNKYLFIVKSWGIQVNKFFCLTFNMILTHAIAFVSLRKAELTSILTYLWHMYTGHTLKLQRACRKFKITIHIEIPKIYLHRANALYAVSCSMPAECTGCLKTSYTYHWVCGNEKFIIDIHIDIFKIYSHRVCIDLQQACSRPAACQQLAHVV